VFGLFGCAHQLFEEARTKIVRAGGRRTVRRHLRMFEGDIEAARSEADTAIDSRVRTFDFGSVEGAACSIDFASSNSARPESKNDPAC